MRGVNSNNLISSENVITIFNLLREIGLNTSHRGSKYLNKAIQLLMIADNDIVIINDIYTNVAKFYGNITTEQVRNNITYALNNRIEEKTIKNFEKVFGFEYDQYYFTNKTIIEEITRIIKIKAVS